MSWISKEGKPHKHKMPIIWPWIRDGSRASCSTCGDTATVRDDPFSSRYWEWDEWEDVAPSDNEGTVVSHQSGGRVPGPPGPPEHTHMDGTQCRWTRMNDMDKWRVVGTWVDCPDFLTAWEKTRA